MQFALAMALSLPLLSLHWTTPYFSPSLSPFSPDRPRLASPESAPPPVFLRSAEPGGPGALLLVRAPSPNRPSADAQGEIVELDYELRPVLAPRLFAPGRDGQGRDGRR